MANTVRIKRRASGGAVGAPSSLLNAELAFNEADLTLYYGLGTGGAGGSATSVIAIGGAGAFVSLTGDQTIGGSKSFSTIPVVGTASTGDNSTKAASTAFVKAQGYLTGITSSQVTTALGYTPQDPAEKGQANGYASLDGDGKVPSIQLPSYVDDVVEYANMAAFPGTGSTGIIYVALDSNKTYRWGGSVYIEISASPGSTDAVAEGSVNLYFTQARARQSISVSGSLSYSSSTGEISFTDAVTSVAGRTGDVTLTKSDVGLSNVENTTLSTWAGTTNITTLGTVTSGTWNATTISVAKGGTGTTTLTGLVKGNGTSAFTAAVAGTDYLSPDSDIDGGTY